MNQNDPYQRIGRDPVLNKNIPPPSWVTHLLGIMTVEVEYDEKAPSTVLENIQDLEPEGEVDTDIFVELLEDLAIH